MAGLWGETALFWGTERGGHVGGRGGESAKQGSGKRIVRLVNHLLWMHREAIKKGKFSQNRISESPV